MTGRGRPGRGVVPTTLRTRVTAVAALAVLAVLSVASAGLVLAQRTALVEALDETLDQHADALAARVRSHQPLQVRDLPSEDVVVEVVGADGTVLAASRDLGGSLGATGAAGQATVELPRKGDKARLVVRVVDDTTIRVAGSLDDVRDSTAALAGSLILAVPLSTAVLAGIVWWAVGRALRPVEDIRARVDGISGSRLDVRVPEPARADEIARLARTMNAMLGRLQRSAEQQRRFVADASHELRSPLTRIRAELEVDAAHPESADQPSTAVSVLAETVTLQRLVDDLLLLARGDAGALDPVDHGPVDLDELVEKLVGRLRAAGSTGVDTGDVRPVQVPGDRDQLERAIGNLLDNAVRHARDRIVVSLTEVPGSRAELAVADDGPGIPLAEQDRVFERFTRLDDARSAGDGGAGLGLAIARDIARRHGGTLRVDPDGWPGARLVLRLPIDQDYPGIGWSGPG
jgi:signal transduction histidine kinase